MYTQQKQPCQGENTLRNKKKMWWYHIFRRAFWLQKNRHQRLCDLLSKPSAEFGHMPRFCCAPRLSLRNPAAIKWGPVENHQWRNLQLGRSPAVFDCQRVANTTKKKKNVAGTQVQAVVLSTSHSNTMKSQEKSHSCPIRPQESHENTIKTPYTSCEYPLKTQQNAIKSLLNHHVCCSLTWVKQCHLHHTQSSAF